MGISIRKYQRVRTGYIWYIILQVPKVGIALRQILLFSQNYSYKVMVQSSGRIDRLNTAYKDLYYYHLKSRSGIDLAISKALHNKKKFNESKFAS